jgi:hypothetical protein
MAEHRRANTVDLGTPKPLIAKKGTDALQQQSNPTPPARMTNGHSPVTNKEPHMADEEVIEKAFVTLQTAVQQATDAVRMAGANAMRQGRFDIAESVLQQARQLDLLRQQLDNVQKGFVELGVVETDLSVLTKPQAPAEPAPVPVTAPTPTAPPAPTSIVSTPTPSPPQIVDEPTHPENTGTGGLKTPQQVFRRPILESLVEIGGSGDAAIVLERVYNKLKYQLNEQDHTTLPPENDTPRWINTARWARNTLRSEGLMRADTPRGTWEITEKGRDWLNGRL